MNRIKCFLKSNKNFVLILFFIGAALIGCEKYVIEGPPRPSDVSFKNNLIPIFTSNCIACHGGAKSPNLTAGAAYTSLTTGNYISKDDPESSKIYLYLTDYHKILGEKLINDPASDTISYYLKDYVLVWIEEGAKNN